MLSDFATALLDFGGGLISDASARKENSKNRRLAREQFNAQMDESVQRRVKDATAAGVHPLFALGASVGASPTTLAGSSNDVGATGRAVSSIANRLADAQIRAQEASAAKDEAEAQLTDSIHKRVQQDLAAQGRDGVKVGSQGVTVGPVAENPAHFIPEVPTRDKTGYETGRAPAQRKLRMPDGREVTIFSESAQADEINQGWLLQQVAKHKLSDVFEAIDRMTGGRWTVSGGLFGKKPRKTPLPVKPSGRGYHRNVNPWR